jgi:hypothetical protein
MKKYLKMGRLLEITYKRYKDQKFQKGHPQGVF